MRSCHHLKWLSSETGAADETEVLSDPTVQFNSLYLGPSTFLLWKCVVTHIRPLEGQSCISWRAKKKILKYSLLLIALLKPYSFQYHRTLWFRAHYSWFQFWNLSPEASVFKTQMFVGFFLLGRSQRVTGGEQSSGEGRVTSPLLGPLLFLAYVNDIWRNTESSIRLYNKSKKKKKK
jgi:hypothetical protein